MDTLAVIYQPLMRCPSYIAKRCFICGRNAPLNQHHYVWRSWGELHDSRGAAIPKPTITLCGFGNHLMDSNGRLYCHGLAHHRRLHFKNDGNDNLLFLVTEEPIDYMAALEMCGWERIREDIWT